MPIACLPPHVPVCSACYLHTLPFEVPIDPCAAFMDSNRKKLTRLCRAAQLVNYPDYRNHEMKALFEWLGRTGRELEVFCIRGPLDGKDYAVELAPPHDLGGFQQSVGFIVAS